ncbi:MAG TPA: transglutaminase domain-containing protein [Gammaproteobacteria bacterium]
MVRAPLWCVIALLAACAAPSGHRRPALSEAELLSGGALGLTLPRDPPISREQAFGLDETMREFVEAQVHGARRSHAALQRLLFGMRMMGLFSIDYDDSVTRTVRDTFYERRGNCLSFTMLFVELAREAGLDVRYQVVDVPPIWSANSDLVIVENHVNALVKTPRGQDFVIDFNMTDYRGRYPQREVDDDRILALFYNNLGAEALIRKEYDLSFRYLRAAIAADPDLAGPWLNLGVLYGKQQRWQHADAAYLHVLDVSPGNRSALTNLASLHAHLGNEELAARYSQEIHRYQQRNPYYHYFVAQRAFEEGRFADALEAVRQALRLKREEHDFHVLEAKTLLELGLPAEAQRSMERANRYADPLQRTAAR